MDFSNLFVTIGDPIPGGGYVTKGERNSLDPWNPGYYEPFDHRQLFWK